MPLSLSATDRNGAMVKGAWLPGSVPAEGSQHRLNAQETSRILWCSGAGVKPPGRFLSYFRLQERGAELWNLGLVGFLPGSLPGTAQIFCAGSGGLLNPCVHLQRDTPVLTTEAPPCPFCVLHCNVKVPGILT